ncbi:MAG: hypothetical protein AAGF12_00150 [Myxococcota bacterium]
MIHHRSVAQSITLACLLSATGCGLLSSVVGETASPAEETRFGREAIQSFESAQSLASQDALSAERAYDGTQAAQSCETSANRLGQMSNDGGDPLYDRAEPLLTTSVGTLSIEQMIERCQALNTTLQARVIEDAPAREVEDPELERRVLEYAKTLAERFGWEDTLREARIRTPNWHIVHHRVSGVPVGRTRWVAVGGVAPDGSCGFYWINVREDYDGGGYTDALRSQEVRRGRRLVRCETMDP